MEMRTGTMRAFYCLIWLISIPASVMAQEIPSATTPNKRAPQHIDSSLLRQAAQAYKEAWQRADKIAGAETDIKTTEQRTRVISSKLSFRNPDEIRSDQGELRATLVAMKTHGVIGEDPVNLRSYNGRLVGPTLRAKPGDILRITLKNDLAPEVHHTGMFNTLNLLNHTNLHVHGLHVSPNGISDNVLLELEPRGTQEYEITIPDDHVCGTFWYHGHRHGSTAVQVGSGMSGVIIIEGGIDTVPAIKAAAEKVFVLQQIPYAYKQTIPVGMGTKTFDYPEGIIELDDAALLLRPGSWRALGLNTTINGDVLPVITVAPGTVERWRFVDTGTREPIRLRLEKLKSSVATAPETLALNEIARDGIPLGRIDSQPAIDLYPGYRSDILFHAPNVADAEYLLVDDTVPAGSTISGTTHPRRYLARIVISGTAKPMAMPTDAELAPFRPTSLGNSTENPAPAADLATIVYQKPASSSFFNIDGKVYDHNTARQNFIRGQIVERKLKTGGGTHVFHIHVNPFEIVSHKRTAPDGTVTELIQPGESYWRDTVALLANEEITMRMELKTFTGLYVQHCHILDHEDNGMMDLVEVTEGGVAGGVSSVLPVAPRKSPAWNLTQSDGTALRSDQLRGKHSIVVFFEGFGCLACNQQLQALKRNAKWFEQHQVQMIAISSDSQTELTEALKITPVPFPVLADPQLNLFGKFGCRFQQSPLHGFFVLDPDQRIVMESVSTVAVGDIDAVLAKVEQVLRKNSNPEVK